MDDLITNISEQLKQSIETIDKMIEFRSGHNSCLYFIDAKELIDDLFNLTIKTEAGLPILEANRLR